MNKQNLFSAYYYQINERSSSAMLHETLPGVDCTVKECAYHTENNKCSADCIKVNGNDSKTSCDTECETFKPHN